MELSLSTLFAILGYFLTFLVDGYIIEALVNLCPSTGRMTKDADLPKDSHTDYYTISNLSSRKLDLILTPIDVKAAYKRALLQTPCR